MSESYKVGSQIRDFLRGLLDVSELRQGGEPRSDKEQDRQAEIEWGPRINLAELRDLYAPHQVEPFTVPPGGIDNLALHSTDIFTIPGRGEFTVDFAGYFRVARDNPTTKDWTTFELLVNIIDLKLYGENKDIGAVTVSLNSDVLSTGQIFPATSQRGAAKCRIATGVVFDLPQVGVSV